KGAYQLPATPRLRLESQATGGQAVLTVSPDSARPVKAVRFYATADAHALTAFWRTIPVVPHGKEWRATVPTLDAKDPLFAYADVIYETPEAYRKIPTNPGVGRSETYALSTAVLALNGAELAAAGVRPDRAPRPDDRRRGQRLAGLVPPELGKPRPLGRDHSQSERPALARPSGRPSGLRDQPGDDTVVYVSVTRNAWGAFGAGTGEYVATVPLKANGDWVAVNLGSKISSRSTPRGRNPEGLVDAHGPQPERTRLVMKDGVKTSLPSGDWKNAATIRVRQLRWVGGQYQGDAPAAPELSDAERTKAFNDAIKASLEQEKKDRDGR
ncbi:hypothetical protein EMGBS10_18630, partial [Opitutia bacterium]